MRRSSSGCAPNSRATGSRAQYFQDPKATGPTSSRRSGRETGRAISSPATWTWSRPWRGRSGRAIRSTSHSDGERLAGRGTTDMKGFLACVLAMVPEFLAMPLERHPHGRAVENFPITGITAVALSGIHRVPRHGQEGCCASPTGFRQAEARDCRRHCHPPAISSSPGTGTSSSWWTCCRAVPAPPPT
jgi:hypothetical protein